MSPDPGRNQLVTALVAVLVLVGTLSGVGLAQFGHGPGGDAPAVGDRGAPLGGTAAAPGDCQFIDDPTGGPYPNRISLTCWDGTPEDESYLDVGMQGAWAYAVVIELPDDAPREMAGYRMEGNPPKHKWVGGNGLTAKEEAPWDERKALWQTKLLASPREDLVVVHSNPNTAFTRGGAVIYHRHASFDDRITLQPGIYEMKLHAYGSYTRSDVLSVDLDARYPGIKQIDTVIDRSPRKTSYARLSIGGCEPNYDTKGKLDRLDRQRLEVLSEVGEIQREYEDQREQFAVNSASLGAQVGLSIFTSGTAGPAIGTAPADMYLNAQKGKELVRKLSEQNEKMSEITDRREAVLDEIDRCVGGPYQVPDDYQPITPQDRTEARQPDGDTRKDG